MNLHSRSIQWATTIPPQEDVKAQAERMATWCGHITAYHVAQEAEDIAAYYANLAVRTVERSGAQVLGKPVPMLGDILSQQYAAEGHICGLINADISLELSDANWQWLAERAEEGLVCIRRTDVANMQVPLSQGTQLPQGYDVFLYPKALIPNLIADGFCFGAPFWDFWMPVAAMLAGKEVAVVTAPVARHIDHVTAWDHAALPFMDIFVRAVHQQAVKSTQARPMLSALCAHAGAAYGAWRTLAGEVEEAAQVMNQVYDDFQIRLLSAVAEHASTFAVMPDCRES